MKFISWIHAGEMRCSDVSQQRNRGEKAQYVVRDEDSEEEEASSFRRYDAHSLSVAQGHIHYLTSQPLGWGSVKERTHEPNEAHGHETMPDRAKPRHDNETREGILGWLLPRWMKP